MTEILKTLPTKKTGIKKEPKFTPPSVIKLNVDDVYRITESLSQGSKWVPFGINNDFPQYLREIYMDSPTNMAVINGISHMIAGKGLKIKNPGYNPMSNAFINYFFPDEILLNLAFDLKTYGFATLKITGKKKITEIEYSPAINWRSGQKNKEDGYIYTYWYNENWTQTNGLGYKPVEFPLFGIGEPADESVLLFQLPLVGYNYYAPVDYSGGISYIELEGEIGQFHLSAIRNGLFPPTIINFNNGIPSEEIQNKIEQMILKKWQGSGNAGRVIIGFNENKESAASFDTLPASDLDKQYQFLSTESTVKILLAHRVTSPLLFGIDKTSGFGNTADELKDAYILFYETVIKGFQDILIHGITSLMEKNLLFGELFIEKKMPYETEVQMSKEKSDHFNEIETIQLLQKYEKIISKPTGKIISEKIFDGKIKQDKKYRFNPASKKNNLFLLKMKEFSDEGNVFDPDLSLIRNTEDFYFTELTVIGGNR
jgi:hypothetical protein